MKIGEAGEAFFVFETNDDDLPPDLITSPILEPTRPDDAAAAKKADASTDRFGAKQDPDEGGDVVEDEGRVRMKNDEEIRPEDGNQEPDFLDLDALPSAEEAKADSTTTQTQNGHAAAVDTTPKAAFHAPSPEGMRRRASTVTPSSKAKSKVGVSSSSSSRPRTPPANEEDRRVDQALQDLDYDLEGPRVEYHQGKISFRPAQSSVHS